MVFIELPWSKIKPSDIINWPSDVNLQSSFKMKTDDLKKIHELVKEDKLDFSPKFISRFKKTLSERKTSDRDQLRSHVAKNLTDKLAKNLNVLHITRLPWSEMKVGDIKNWPPDVKFTSVFLLNTNDVRKLHNLVRKDKLDFSPEFLINYKKLLNIKD